MPAVLEAPTKRASIFSPGHNLRRLFKRPGGQEPVIDGVRALAILWVLALHLVFLHLTVFPARAGAVFNAPLTSWTANGLFGVDMFFVISGFLIGSILFREYRTEGTLLVGRFYVRRFLRLIPVYAAAMLLALLFLKKLPPFWAPGNAVNAWANLLYVNNFLSTPNQFMPWCWSLAIEEQFYVLLPACILLMMGLRKRRIAVFLALMVFSVVLRYVVLRHASITFPFNDAPYSAGWYRRFDIEYDKIWMRFGGLLAGVTGAYLNCFFVPQLRSFFARGRLVTTLATGSLLIVLASAFIDTGSRSILRLPHVVRQFWLAASHDIFSVAIMFLIFVGMYSRSGIGTMLQRVLSWKGFYPIAQLSYSAYLTHEMIFQWLFPQIGPNLALYFGPARAMAIDSVVGLASTGILSCGLYLFIEQPCMQLRSHPAVLRVIRFFSGVRTHMAAAEAR
ncbi:MAG TPA: acyltransferase [Terracidiphilus sp.]|nr:acyltransferase [Terracidiphilus sp.]